MKYQLKRKWLLHGAEENSNENIYDNEYEYNDSLSELEEGNGITIQWYLW